MTDHAADADPVDARNAAYRALPSVDALTRDMAFVGVSPETARVVARRALAEARRRIAAGDLIAPDRLRAELTSQFNDLAVPRLVPVLNATGVIIHTNLGRAPVSVETAAAMAAAASHPVPLELDPGSNLRGDRMHELSALLRTLTGAEATLVVNNGAAAVLLTIAALGAGREVVVSRGEAVEIGGGFRIPEIVRQSGALLVEVGTTNRTYVDDYVNALTERTAAWLRVHPSNFALTGFTSRPTPQALAGAAGDAGLPLIEDLGSGAVLRTADYGLPAEPTIAEALAAGASVVTFSGDKLLGGPQAGVICGDPGLVASIARHPLARAVRADKTVLAGVATTLRHYLAGEATARIPVWRMLTAPVPALRERAATISIALAGQGIRHAVVETTCAVGGGALPTAALPGVAIALTGDVDNLARRFRTGAPAVHGRIDAGALLFELRTILPEDDEVLTRAIHIIGTAEH